MYGMVNKAVDELVCSKFGEAKWIEIKRLAGVDIEVFISDESYPDAVTYQLIGAVCRTLGAEASTVLHLFGRHWILHTAREGYGELMQGRDVPDAGDRGAAAAGGRGEA